MGRETETSDVDARVASVLVLRQRETTKKKSEEEEGEYHT